MFKKSYRNNLVLLVQSPEKESNKLSMHLLSKGGGGDDLDSGK